jgi:hypothetical protein
MTKTPANIAPGLISKSRRTSKASSPRKQREDTSLLTCKRSAALTTLTAKSRENEACKE